MVVAECPRVSRLTDSTTPHSVALVAQAWRKSWNVRFSILASRQAPVKPVLMSEMRCAFKPLVARRGKRTHRNYNVSKIYRLIQACFTLAGPGHVIEGLRARGSRPARKPKA